MDDFLLRRKWTLKAHDRQIVFVKRPGEKAEHVLMKALLWALYLPMYPDLGVEIAIGDRYKPDVVSLDGAGRPRFWGEAGQVGTAKIRSIAKRFQATHFAIGKWGVRLEQFSPHVAEALDGLRRTAPVDLITFPTDSADCFIDANGRIGITLDDLAWVRL